MKASEMRELGADALDARIAEARKELVATRLKFKSKGEVEKPVRMRAMRREIARMLTVRNAAKKEAR